MIATIQALNALLSFALTVMAIFLLIRFFRVYNFMERLGHGVAGAAMFIAGFKQAGLALQQPWIALMILPWDPLYQLSWRLGWLAMLGGKIWRLERHRRGNIDQNRIAAEYFADRDKAPPFAD